MNRTPKGHLRVPFFGPLRPLRQSPTCFRNDWILQKRKVLETMSNIQNEVQVTGQVHLIHGEMQKCNRMGDYLRFSIRQDRTNEDGSPRHDFLLIRAYDSKIQEMVGILEEKQWVRVRGEIRSSLGSGEMYILSTSLEVLP